MGFNAINSTFKVISKVVSLLRIYLGAITSALLRSLQATDSFPTWSVVGGNYLIILLRFEATEHLRKENC